MKKFLRPYRHPKDVSDTASNPSSKESEKPKETELRCKFHPGTPVNKVWTCCGRHVSADPCSGSQDHVAAQDPRDDQIEKIHQYHATPSVNFQNVCHFSDRYRFISGNLQFQHRQNFIDIDVSIKE